MLNVVLISPSEDFHRFDCDDLGLKLEILLFLLGLNAILKENKKKGNFAFNLGLVLYG